MQQFLLEYRLTPHATTRAAPCEMLLGRKLRSRLDLVLPDAHANVSQAQHRQCASYDKKSRSRSFTAGQEVWVKTFSRNAPKWSLGVISKPVGPVSFLINVNGQIMKRHIDQVLEAHVKPRPPPSDPVDDDDFLYTPELPIIPPDQVPEAEPEQIIPNNTEESVDQSTISENSQTEASTSYLRPRRQRKPLDRLTYSRL